MTSIHRVERMSLMMGDEPRNSRVAITTATRDNVYQGSI
ncbi:hypothetical protein VIMY103929_10495 [Vibrio mytili]